MRALLIALMASAVVSPAGAQTVFELDGQEFDPGEPVQTDGADAPNLSTVPEPGLGQAGVGILPDGAVIVDPNEVQNRPAPRQPSSVPVVGSQRLLDSLADLDRPLTPEEVTAYGAFVQQQLPLRPELVLDFNQRRNAVARANAQPGNGRRPSTRSLQDSVRLDLAPNSNPDVIATTQGTVTTLAFFDRTGAPWPIASYVIGNEAAYQVYPLQEGSNQIAISQQQPYTYSNLIVSLLDTGQSLVFDLETSDDGVIYRRDVTVNALGPNAEIAPVVAREPDARASDGLMMAVVQGAPIPPSAQELFTDDADVEAYRIGDALYIRTNQTLISPSYDAALSGPGGINAYRMKPAPVVLIERNGQITRVRIS